MIKIQFICDKCRKFNPYVPSKGSSVVCASCHHVEEIPIPTKIKIRGVQLFWNKIKKLFTKKIKV